VIVEVIGNLDGQVVATIGARRPMQSDLKGDLDSSRNDTTWALPHEFVHTTYTAATERVA